MFDNMEFASPMFLWGLLLVPIALVWYVMRHKKRESSVRFSSTDDFDRLPKSWKYYLRHILFCLQLVALSLLFVVMARPQSASVNHTSNIDGIDIMMAMDVSGSMLACDLKPNRLDASKAVVADFVEGRSGDRMGLVIFAGESFTQVPLTTDHAVLLNMIKDVKSGMIDDGTAIGDGLATAINRLRSSDAVSKVIILLTDGVNNRGSVDPMTAAEMAKLYGIRIYTIGVGTYGTAPYPVQTIFGTQYQDIEVEIDEKLLKNMAQLTEGKYYRATSNKKLMEIYDEIDKLERSKIEVTEFRRLHEEFYPFAFWALIFILAEFILRKTIFRTISA